MMNARAVSLGIGIGLFLAPALAGPLPGNGSSSGAPPGTIHVVWGDPLPGRGETGKMIVTFVTDEGEVLPLIPVAPDTPDAADDSLGAPSARVQLASTTGSGGLPVSAPSEAWATLLCRFSDSTGVTPRPVSWFDGLVGDAWPGMAHYWNEITYGALDLSGNRVFGWYDLPGSRHYYYYDQDGDGFPELDLSRITNDCMTRADGDVYFPEFYGLNILFNEDTGNICWGGITRPRRFDGEDRSYGATWMGPSCYAQQSIVAHEMGHGFGIPHSDCPYWEKTGGCTNPHPDYGCIAIHEIGYHKHALLGAIDPARLAVVAPDQEQLLHLEGVGDPDPNGISPVLALVPVGDAGTRLYTVESRVPAGYDSGIDAPAVIIQEVDIGRAELANIVDDDGGACSDAGAAWLPGEKFIDPDTNISVRVVRSTSTGYEVVVENLSCVISVGAISHHVDPEGGPGSIPVTTQDYCTWRSESHAPWIRITGGWAVSGTASASFVVDPNPVTVPRQGFLTVAGRLIEVTQSGNDSCPDSKGIIPQRGRYTDSINTEQAATEPAGPTPPCAPAAPKSVWYSHQSDQSGILFAHAGGSSYDTVLGVFEGGCTSADARPLSCVEDAAGWPDERISLPVVAGREYNLLLAAPNDDGGEGVLNAYFLSEENMFYFDNFDCAPGNSNWIFPECFVTSARWVHSAGDWRLDDGGLIGRGTGSVETFLPPHRCSTCSLDVDLTLPDDGSVITMTNWYNPPFNRVKLNIDAATGGVKLIQHSGGKKRRQTQAFLPIQPGSTHRFRMTYEDAFNSRGRLQGHISVYLDDELVIRMKARKNRRPVGTARLKVTARKRSWPVEVRIEEIRLYENPPF